MSGSVITVDLAPRVFIRKAPSQYENWTIPSVHLESGKEKVIPSQIYINFEGTAGTAAFYVRFDPDAGGSGIGGHKFTGGDDLMLRNASALRNLAIYTSTTGNSEAFTVTLMG